MRRRHFLAASAAALYADRALSAKDQPLKIGVTDWNLRLTGKLEAIGLAKSLGFDGVQVSIGRKAAEGKMPMDNPDLIARFVAESKARQMPINGTCLDILHTNCLKNDKLAEKWIADSIRITAALGTRVILLPFFGKCAIPARADIDAVSAAVRNLAPDAEKAGVILGLENTISAEDNLRILEAVKSPAVQVYYDIGNSTNGGFDILKEIRTLGAARICQFHLKDNPYYLGDGRINMRPVVEAIRAIGYQGYANLETDSPGNVEADMRRNLSFVRGLLG